MNSTDRLLMIGIVPGLVAGVVYEVFLGHRHDYTGHFIAGYGGTYGAILVWLRMLPPIRYHQTGSLHLVLACVACILLGTFLEATAFRIAKFDEVDFCNQSLGAVLAAIAAVSFLQSIKPSDRVFDYGLITGIVFLGVGGCYAVA